MKKHLNILLALALCACLLAGCAPQAPAAEAPAQPAAPPAEPAVEAPEAPAEEPAAPIEGTVTIYTSVTEDELDLLQSMAAEQYPDLELEYVAGGLGECIARLESEKEKPMADVCWGGRSASPTRTRIITCLHRIPQSITTSSRCRIPTGSIPTMRIR